MEKINLWSGAKKLIKGFVISAFIMIAGILINALILYTTEVKMEISPFILTGFMSLSCFFAGFTTAAAVGRKGLMCGLASGLFMIVLFNAMFFIIAGYGFFVSARMALFLIPVVISAFGGILSVGRK